MHSHVRCLQKHEVRNWERFLGDRRERKSGQKVGLMIILNADFGINCTTRLMFVVYALRCISKSVQKFVVFILTCLHVSTHYLTIPIPFNHHFTDTPSLFLLFAYE